MDAVVMDSTGAICNGASLVGRSTVRMWGWSGSEGSTRSGLPRVSDDLKSSEYTIWGTCSVVCCCYVALAIRRLNTEH